MLVVIGIDGSELAVLAAKRARDLVREDAEFLLVSAHESVDTDAGGIEGPVLTPDEQDSLARAAHLGAETALTEAAAALDLVGARQEAIEGDAGPALCRLAERSGADLIVVGSHGRNAISRLFLGSTSQYVVQHAPCAVLVVRQAVVDGEHEDHPRI